MDDPRIRHLRQLRSWRTARPRDLSLGYLAEHVKRHIVRPRAQLGRVVKLWQQHLPAHIVQRSTLVSLQRGVLRVHVDDAATLYELDRLLRGGLARTITTQARAPIRRIKTAVAHSSA